MTKLKTAILGASGYTGAEAIRFIQNHPKLTIRALTANRHAGKPFAQVYPHLAYQGLPDLQAWQNVDWSDIDIVFACLPHGASQETIAKIYPAVSKIIDLSADFRLKDPEIYAKTYNRTHVEQDLLKTAVYGLSEFARADLKDAKLVACPGCYPTASLLPILPVVDLVETQDIIVNALSGVSGAGRKESTALIYPEVAEGAHAYGIGVHRHGPEIDQAVSRVAGKAVTVSFTPHLVPMNRGMVATISLRRKNGVDISDIRAALTKRYISEPFVHIEGEGIAPHTRHVRGSNQCRIGVFPDRNPNRVILTSVIDNLAKGSSGQALQNLNIMMGWEETLGLTASPIFP